MSLWMQPSFLAYTSEAIFTFSKAWVKTTEQATHLGRVTIWWQTIAKSVLFSTLPYQNNDNVKK
jgi:hypothetical protein